MKHMSGLYDPKPDIRSAVDVSDERAQLLWDHISMYHNYRGYTINILRKKLSRIGFLSGEDVEALIQSPAVVGDEHFD